MGRCRDGQIDGISSQELFERIRDVSLGLASLGIGTGDRVSIIAESRPEWVICDMAILLLGAVTVPIYPTLNDSQVRYILADSAARVAIVSNKVQLEKVQSVRHLLPDLAAMKSDAILVNVSRGKLVDEAKLAHALSAGSIGGAALDVFEHEPLDAASPLWTLPNVIVTPHTSGFRADHWDAATDLFAQNLRRFDSRQPLLNLVDKAAGY